MSLHDRINKAAEDVIQEEREAYAARVSPFVSPRWIQEQVFGMTEAEINALEEAKKEKKEKVDKLGKKEVTKGKDLEKEIEAGEKEVETKEKDREAKKKAPVKKAAPPEEKGEEKPEADDKPEKAEPTDPAPKTDDKDEPEEKDDKDEEGDDAPGGATDAAGASATEPVGPARTADDCKRDHATAIGQADQHAREEQGHRAKADKHRSSVEDFANEYEDAGGQVSQVNGQRHLHPPTADDSPELHDIYQRFDDALWQRDENELKAIEAHRKKRDARGHARRHDYESQTGEKWSGDDHPPGFGHHHVDVKGKGKDEKKEKKEKKPKNESLDDTLRSLDLLI